MSFQTFTSESVCAGHPDKICDQISDAILDEAYKIDLYSRIAIETLVTKNHVTIAGEVTSKAKLDYEQIARGVIKSLGYTDPSLNFTYESPIIIKIQSQSPEIAQGVDINGAGDQGMMFGYACNQTPQLMPLPIALAHELTQTIDQARESGKLSYLKPDGKAQVTVEYESGKPIGIDHITLATPHDKNITLKKVKKDLYEKIVKPVLDKYGYTVDKDNIIVNGTGIWHYSGPGADSGVTGRKIVVDTYGGYARVGGGAFSGKDPTKVDRSGAYAARYLAKNIIAKGLADECEVRLAYFIGAKKPVMQYAETFGSAKKSQKVIDNYMNSLLDTSVKGIIEGLDLRQPFYRQSAVYGHFGREIFPWEKTKQ